MFYANKKTFHCKIIFGRLIFHWKEWFLSPKRLYPEILKLKNTLIKWSQEIVNSFTFINGRRITNGIMESRNGVTNEIKKNANGYKNFPRFRNRCLYCMNKDTKPNYAGSHKSIRMKGKRQINQCLWCYKQNPLWTNSYLYHNGFIYILSLYHCTMADNHPVMKDRI